MKKLLGLLSAVGLIATTSTSVIACSVHSDQSHWSLNDMLAGVLTLTTTTDENSNYRNSQDDIYNYTNGGMTFESLRDSFFETYIVAKIKPFINHKKIDSKNQKITVDMSVGDISNSDNAVRHWVTKAITLVVINGTTLTPLPTNDYVSPFEKLLDGRKDMSIGIQFDWDMPLLTGNSNDNLKNANTLAPKYWSIFKIDDKEDK